MTMDQQFVEFVVKAIVGNPDAVEVERTIDEKGVLLELTVDPSDLGRVIGKRGNTAQSIRTLLRALGTKNDARYNLKIVDNGEEAPQKAREEEASGREDESVASDQPAEEASETSSGNQWAHLSSSNDDQTEAEDEEDEESSTGSTNETVEKTKKELADLDDLNI